MGGISTQVGRSIQGSGKRGSSTGEESTCGLMGRDIQESGMVTL